ncbi:2-oxoglutarate dehydrogenase E1 component [Bordetella petrii]|nr:2-oxoglutarate dehydrogenase E1 component [Bordetella petrii]
MSSNRPTPVGSAIHAAAAPFLEDMYHRYRSDPASVHQSWSQVFQLVDELVGIDGREEDGARWQVERLRNHGHLRAGVNPLGAAPGPGQVARRATAVTAGMPSVAAATAAYCGSLGIETAHIGNDEIVAWIRQAVESMGPRDAETLLRAHRKLARAEQFERFLAKKFPGKKRFGAEGAESLIPLLDRLLRNAAADGVAEVVIGTMHRGRLNLAANVLDKPLDALLAEFKGAFPYASHDSCADVPYHLGFETTLHETGLRVTLLPNPSHLEAVDAVVLGNTRARQDMLAGAGRAKVLGIVLHTDAAVVGQGVVAETLQLAHPAGFCTGGTIHVVVNNQLGFTTEPDEGRSSHYCTGPWKAIDSLIVHANGDDVEAMLRAADLASGFRAAHSRDAVIDLVCYRRNGHNEIDEPRFTQPGLYRVLDAKPTALQRFEAELLDAGTLSPSVPPAIKSAYQAELDAAYARMAEWRPVAGDAPPRAERAASGSVPGVDEPSLRAFLAHLAAVPDDIAIEAKLARLVRQRGDTGKGIVWAVAEALAFASLLADGIAIRLTGQDVVRGAFSHRHFALTDVHNGRRHISLRHLPQARADFQVINSPLSEYAVLGYEYGYSLANRQALTIWEAQFGDFANGAQIMIDQFIASGEEKWRQQSSLVMLLPHGLEGQGPEHSSARIERFLQLAAQDNLRIAIPTTPANYFHLLRQQAHDPVRKPLVVFAPKTLLRLPAAVSALPDFAAGTAFQPLHISGPGAEHAGDEEPVIDRVLFCCGKIAYELEGERQRRDDRRTAIVRLEQLYPLPTAALSAFLRKLPHATLIWVQEEPANMGAWSWLDRQLEAVARACGVGQPQVGYRGRPESASPAGSFHELHSAHQAAIVAAAFQ